MSGSPTSPPNGGGCASRGPPASSLRLKLGAVRLPAEGSLDMLGEPPQPAATAAGKLRLRLRASAVDEKDALAAKSGDAEVDLLPVPVGKAHRHEATDPKRGLPGPALDPERAAGLAAKAATSAGTVPATTGSNGAAVRRPPPPFPSAPQPVQTASSSARLEKPTPPGKRPTPKVVAAPNMGAAISYAKRSPAVEPGPPLVPLTKVKVPVLKDELSKYDIQRKVGEGTYGEVYLARERQSGLPVAIKKLKVLEQMEGLPNTTLREITILQSLKAFNECKHFAALREVVMAPDYRSLHLVFEFVEHSLYGLMVQGMRFTEADYRCVFRQVLRGLAVLHEAHIVHRDIKPNNILVDNAGNVKLCDFGLAFSTTAGRNRITPRLVALAYRPPEMLLNASSYSSSVDVWSVGCMLAQVYLGGSPPFMRNASQPADSEVEQLALVGAAYGLRAGHVSTLLGMVPDGVEPSSPVAPPVLSEQHLASRLERHIVTMARERKQPPIPKPVITIICKALTLDPARRPSARELLRSGWFMNSVNETVERAAMARRIRDSTGDRFCHTAAGKR